ncbi:hypothetical protein HAX54_028736 [Datura stramonium]|uniref:Uncharacterized protein n=1 Tax=Datura stramonium TaxID=4076 RepID=A0ABS8V785_DATST|nr:hypothetical protein [Datura stramonium]
MDKRTRVSSQKSLMAMEAQTSQIRSEKLIVLPICWSTFKRIETNSGYHRRHWKKYKKEVMAALLGGLTYHTRKARNWRLFKRVNVQSSDIVTQLKRIYSHSKRAHR